MFSNSEDPTHQVIHGMFYAHVWNRGMGEKNWRLAQVKDNPFSAARSHHQGNLEEQPREGLHVDNEPLKEEERGEDWGSWLRHLMAMYQKGESSGSFREPNHLSSGQCLVEWFHKWPTRSCRSAWHSSTKRTQTEGRWKQQFRNIDLTWCDPEISGP